MTRFPVLETKRLTLRAPDQRDEPAMLAFYAPPFAEFWGGPFDRDAAWGKYAAMVGQWTLRGHGMFAATLRDTGETVCMAGAFHPAHFTEPEMSWLVTSPAHEGKGIAREACKAVIAHYFNDLGWSTFVSFVHADNAPSYGLAKRLGAELDPETPANLPNCVAYRHRRPA